LPNGFAQLRSKLEQPLPLFVCKRAPGPVLLGPVGCRVSKVFFNPGSGGEDESWPGFGEAGGVAAAAAGI
jgi:hypothetical protein